MATSEVNTEAEATVPHEHRAEFGLDVASLGLGDGHCDFMQNVDRCRSLGMKPMIFSFRSHYEAQRVKPRS